MLLTIFLLAFLMLLQQWNCEAMLNLLLHLGARVMAFNTPEGLRARYLWLISTIMLALRPQILGQLALWENFPSLDASECDPPNVELAVEAYPSPPASESCNFVPSVIESHHSQDLDSLPFPLNPVSLPTSNSNAVTNQVDAPRRPRRSRHSTRNNDTACHTRSLTYPIASAH